MRASGVGAVRLPNICFVCLCNALQLCRPSRRGQELETPIALLRPVYHCGGALRPRYLELQNAKTDQILLAGAGEHKVIFAPV